MAERKRQLRFSSADICRWRLEFVWEWSLPFWRWARQRAACPKTPRPPTYPLAAYWRSVPRNISEILKVSVGFLRNVVKRALHRHTRLETVSTSSVSNRNFRKLKAVLNCVKWRTVTCENGMFIPDWEPRTPGLTKSTSAKYSCKSFWMGVPVNITLAGISSWERSWKKKTRFIIKSVRTAGVSEPP